MTSEEPTADLDDGFDLLDLAIAFAENLKWLILLPLAAGLAGFGVGQLLPKSYVSTSLLRLAPADEVELQAPLTLDLVLKSIGATGATREQRYRWLNDRIKLSRPRATGAARGAELGLATLATTGADPAAARKLNQTVIAAIVELSRPRLSERTRLEQQIAVARDELKSVSGAIATVERRLAGALPLEPLSNLFGLRAGYSKELAELNLRLEGHREDQFVVSPPTLADEPASRASRWLGPLAAMAMLVGVATVIALRRLLANFAVRDPRTTAKLRRLRAAFRRKRTA